MSIKLSRVSSPVDDYKIVIEDLGPDRKLRYRAYIEEFGRLACYGLGKTVKRAIAALTEDRREFVAELERNGLPIPEPHKSTSEFSGKFVLRTGSELHAYLAQAAGELCLSINTFVVAVLNNYRQAAKGRIVPQRTQGLPISANWRGLKIVPKEYLDAYREKSAA